MSDEKKKKSGQLIRLDHRSLRKRKGAGESVEEAAIILKLAGVHKKLDQFSEAEKLLKRSLAIQDRLLDAGSDPLIAATAFELGDLYELLERLVEAETQFKRALAVRSKAPAEHAVEYVEAGWRLSLVLFDRGSIAEAETVLRPLLEFLEARPEPDEDQKEQLRLLYQTLGKVLMGLARFPEALQAHRRALELLEQQGLHEDLGFFDALCYLGETHLHMEDFEGAEGWLLRALALAELLFGPEDPEYVEVLERLQEVYEAMWGRLNPTGSS